MSDTTVDEASTGWDSTASLFRLTLACHPDLRRVGEVADLDAEQMAMGVCRLFPTFGPAGWPSDRPLDDRRVSRQPVRFDIGAEGLTLHPTATTRLNGAAAEGPTRLSDNVCRSGFLVSFGKGVLVHVREHVDGLLGEAPLLGVSAEAGRVERALRRLAPLEGPVLIEGSADRDEAVGVLARLRGRGEFVDLTLAGVGTAAALHDALFGPEGSVVRAGPGVLWLRDIGQADDGMVPVLEQLLAPAPASGELLGSRARVVATVASANDVPASLRARFDDVVVLPARCPMEDVAWRLGRGLVERLTEVGREELVTRSPGWVGASTMTRLLALDSGPGREVDNLARRLALESPDSGLELPTVAPSSDGSVSDDALLVELEGRGWRISAAARALGMSPNTLRKRMGALGLVSASDLTAEQISAASTDHGQDVEAMARSLRVSAQGLRLRMSRDDAR